MHVRVRVGRHTCTRRDRPRDRAIERERHSHGEGERERDQLAIPVSHVVMSPLNILCSNIESILRTLDVCHFDKSLLNTLVYANM